ncbi:MAG: 2'-5' RNA ligase family protein, partial [Ktedonobacterales bacterium]
MENLQDWCHHGYPGIFRAKDFSAWVEWGSRNAPIATQAQGGVQINFPSVVSAAKFYGIATPAEVVGDEIAPDMDWYRQRRKDATDDDTPKWTGVMVGFFLRPTEAQRLAIPEGESVLDLHMTLAYLGDGNELQRVSGDTDFKLLRAAIARFAGDHDGFDAVVSGIGRFTTVPADAPTPIYASVDCPALPLYRHQLLSCLARNGYLADTTHGFTPHITLAR